MQATRKPLGRASTLALVLVAASLLPACDLDGFFDPFDNDFDSCSSASGNVDVAGTWHLRASGSRSSCDDDRFDGDFRILEVELEVRQVEDPQNSRLDQLELVTVPTVPGGQFVFTGSVDGTCVDFVTREDGTTGYFRFEFDGNQDSTDLAGTFTGDGPPGCNSSGEFRVEIE